MKILVTGANGYLGQGVVKQLLDDGNEVIATDISIDNIDKRALRIKINIFEINEPMSFFHTPDILLHLAWRNGFSHDNFSHIEDLPKHYLFIKNLIDNGIKQISILGTMHEVGFFEGSINEKTPTNPQNLYGIAKDALRKSVELLCKSNNVNFQWIRGFYIVGHNDFGSSVFSKISKAVKQNQSSFPFTNGKNQCDFIDYDLFCKQVGAIVEQNRINGIINACSGYPEKLSTRVEQYIKDNNYDIKLDYGAFPDRLYDSKAIWGNDEKIKEIMDTKVEDRK